MSPRATAADGKPSRSAETRRRILDATASVIRERGFVGATTAAIAAAAGVNEGVIFYHYGSMSNLYAETLQHTVTERLDAYDDGLSRAEGLGAVLDAASGLFAEDDTAGYMTVLSQLIAGASAVEELRPRLVEHVEQWIDLVGRHFTGGVSDGPFGAFLPPERDLAVLVVAVFMGAELLADLDPSIGSTDALLGLARRLAALDALAAGGGS